jgi:hypothetical protein
MSSLGQVIQAPDLAANPKVSVGGSVITPQLDIVPKNLKSSKYRWHKVTQISGGSSLQLSTNPTQSIFNISGNALYNLSRSYLTLDAAFAAAGANILTTCFVDRAPVDSMQLLYEGRVIADIPQAQLYSKVCAALATDNKEFMSNGPVYGDTVLGNALPISQTVAANPVGGFFSNITASTTLANMVTGAPVATVSAANEAAGFIAGQAIAVTLTNPMPVTVAGSAQNRTTAQLLANYPSDADLVADGTNAITISANPADQTSGSDLGVRSQQKLVSSAANAALQIRYKIPLNVFLGTILALDKNLYFGQNLQLVINYVDFRQLGFVSRVNGTADLGEIVNAPTVTKHFFWLCEDTNADNFNNMRQAVMSGGVSIACPYTYCRPLTFAANSGTISLPLTQGMGINLKRAITVPVIASAVTSQKGNNWNVASVKFTNVQSSLDSRPLQDQKLVVADSDLWNYIGPFIKNSVAGMSQRCFESNCFFMDNFSDCDDSTKFRENDALISGLALTQPQHTYDVAFERSSASNITLFQYQTWARLLNISPAGLNWASS